MIVRWAPLTVHETVNGAQRLTPVTELLILRSSSVHHVTPFALLRVLVAPVLVLAIAGCGDGEQSTQQPQQDARLATALSPAAVTRQCRDVAGIKTVVVRCPTRLPGGGRESLLGNLVVEGSGEWGRSRCDWLTGYRYPRQGGRDPGPVFHLLMGGRCEPLPLTTRDGRWPADVKGIEPSLRLIGYGSLSVGDPPGTPFPRVRPRVLARTSVGTEPALVLAFGPYPGSGTVHGGHQAIVFNYGGQGQTVSLHFTRGSRAQRIALLVDVAESVDHVGQ